VLRKNLMQWRAHRLGTPACHGHADARLSGDAALGAHPEHHDADGSALLAARDPRLPEWPIPRQPVGRP
jgi:hypothetical protein